MSKTNPMKWNTSRFDDFAVLQRGFDLPVQDRKVGNIPIYGSNGIVGYHNTHAVQGEGVITGRSGSLGDVLFVNQKYWPLNTSLYVKEFHGNEPKFVYFFLEQFPLEKYGTGTGVPTLNRNNIHSCSINYPPLPEQNKIATILTSVDNVIEKTQAQIDKLNDLKTGMMQELLTKGIGPDGKPHTEFKDSPVGRIPIGWDVVPVSQLAEVVDPQPDHRTPKEVSDGVPYIGMGELSDSGEINFRDARKVSAKAYEKQIKSFDIDEGAFMFGKIGTIGQPYILPLPRFYCLSANIVLLTSKNHLYIRYLFQVFQSELVLRQISSQTNTTSQPALGIKKIREFIIPKQNNETELESITNSLEIVDNSIQHRERKLKSYRLLKKALMQDLLTGKVRVTPDPS